VLVHELCTLEYLTVFGVSDDIGCHDILNLVESSDQLQRIPKVTQVMLVGFIWGYSYLRPHHEPGAYRGLVCRSSGLRHLWNLREKMKGHGNYQ